MNTENPLSQSPDLHLLNQEAPAASFTPSRKLTGFLSKIRRSISSWLLGSFFVSEARFRGSVARHLNRVSQVLDQGLLGEIKEEQEASLHSFERRFSEQFFSRLAVLESRLSSVENNSHELIEQVEAANRRALGVEQLLEASSRVLRNKKEEGEEFQLPSAEYLILENRFRGSEEEISLRQRHYPEIFSEAKLPVLEIGSGRGELQELFKAQLVPSYGVELDQAMFTVCQNKGLDVRLEDGLAHLRKLEANSLGGLVAIQVIEHLEPAVLRELMELGFSRIQPGGCLVFETINPLSVVSLAHNYFRDPTHVSPIHPDTLRFALEITGFERIEQKMLSPFPAEAQLGSLPISEWMPPRYKQNLEIQNRNIQQINALLFGFQDYCMEARVPDNKRESY